MNTITNALVQKLWNYCNVLRDDGMSYGNNVEQLKLTATDLAEEVIE
jgi:type I restriction enzyme M protein